MVPRRHRLLKIDGVVLLLFFVVVVVVVLKSIGLRK